MANMDDVLRQMEEDDLADAATHRCARCKEDKPRSAFAKNVRYKSGLQSYCKSCMRQHQKDSIARDGGWASSVQGQAWRRSYLKVNYGVTPEWYDEQELKQEGRCAVCRQLPPEHKRLAVDHNHGTGQARGLLCDPCNMGIGKFIDNADLLERAAAYLRSYS